jgi:phospholipase/carboxylesterase
VQAVNNTELITFENWTLRVRPSQTPKRLLVLVHGLTGDENSMWVFTRGLSSNYWIIAPRAPYTAEAGGYSWRPSQFENLDKFSFEMLGQAAEGLIRLIDAYSGSVGVDAKEFDLMGFSQGAAMISVVAMLYPQRVHKMCVLAGFVPLGLEEVIEKRPLEGKPVFVAHGTQDDKVPIDRARASIKLLERAGARITYCEDEVGHKVSATCLRALESFLSNSDVPRSGEG